jgi:hypothetical protein
MVTICLFAMLVPGSHEMMGLAFSRPFILNIIAKIQAALT